MFAVYMSACLSTYTYMYVYVSEFVGVRFVRSLWAVRVLWAAHKLLVLFTWLGVCINMHAYDYKFMRTFECVRGVGRCQHLHVVALDNIFLLWMLDNWGFVGLINTQIRIFCMFLIFKTVSNLSKCICYAEIANLHPFLSQLTQFQAGHRIFNSHVARDCFKAG